MAQGMAGRGGRVWESSVVEYLGQPLTVLFMHVVALLASPTLSLGPGEWDAESIQVDMSSPASGGVTVEFVLTPSLLAFVK